MPLTEIAIKALKPTDRIRKVTDERGLYLEIAPAGGKWWRFKYYFAKKEKRLSVGTYPDVSLKSARDRREEMRALLAKGIDPAEHRKAARDATAGVPADSFEVVAREFLAKRTPVLHPTYATTNTRRLEMYIYPRLGSLSLSQVTAPLLLSALRVPEERNPETAHRVLQICGQVFRYGIATGRCERDVAADLRGALRPVKTKHFAAVTDPKELADLLRDLYRYPGSPTVATALKLSPLLFVRPGELRQARWSDIDLDAGEWRYVASKTKHPHVVPLSTQAILLLRELQPLTQRSTYVFPTSFNAARPMSENTVLQALRRLDIGSDKMTGHGFRATARTILAEVLKFPEHIIEHQLAHAVRDPNGRAYNRTAFLEERQHMMQAWADYLDELRSPMRTSTGGRESP